MAGKLTTVFGVAVFACAAVLAPSMGMAQSFPTKPVRFVVPYPPGGPLDEVARAAAQRLTPIWGQQVIVGVLPHIWSGKVRAIAISSSGGSRVLPDIPAVAATLPQFNLDGWMGVLVRAGTPPGIIAKMYKDIATAVGNKDFRERFAKRGAEVEVGGPEGLEKIIRGELVLYGNIIKAAHIKPE